MAGRTTRMANAQVRGQGGMPTLSLLYLRGGGADRVQATDRHEHPYWQLEVLTAAGASVDLDGGSRTLHTGDLLILPPHCPHRFRYRPGATWLSLRYLVAGTTAATPTLHHERDLPAFAPFRRLLTALYPQALADPRMQPALTQAALALLALLHRPAVDGARDPLVARVDDAIAAANGRHLSVLGLARILGYSRNHLCSRYKALSGRSLKERIDDACAEAAQRMLHYDDRGITAIAEALGFPDAYGFSRFFLRVAGMRPSAWRDQVRSRT